jgi:5-hydroxyisourate hydrolase
MPRLSTHILDTARGRPAAGIPIDLHRLHAGGRTHLASAVTNADGRTDAPLLAADRLEAGTYEITFRVGGYLRGAAHGLPDPLFLDDIVVRVGIAEADGDYHVPLLLSPHGYTVYRGS